MTALTLHPYLFFGGNCREAMEFYRTIFGGELTVSTYGDGPADAHQDPKANREEMKSKIMFSRLQGEVILLASDHPYYTETQNNGPFSLSLEGSEEEKLTRYFEQLSQDGQITAPLIKQFWGETFGMVKDRYGIHWMFTIKAG